MSASRLATAAVLVAALAAGCGGSDKKDDAAKDTAPTKAQAEAAAKAINLVTADLPGYDVEPADDTDDSTDKDLETCLGLSTADPVADLSSDDFSKGAPPSGVQVSSEVSVVASTAQAKKELAAFTSDKATSCLQTTFDKAIRDEAGDNPGVTIAPLKVTKGTSTATGTDGSFAFSLTSSVSAQGLSIPITIDVDGFLVKHTEVTFFTLGFGQGLPAAERSALLTKLVDRAKTKAV